MKSFLLVPFAVLMLAASDAQACQCLYTPNPPCFAYGQAGAIFEGVVLDIKKVKRTEENGQNARRVRFQVLHTFKGVTGGTSIIYTGDGRADCGYRFKVGKKYLVYAYGSGTPLVTSFCTRTRESREGDEDRAYFANRSSRPTGVHIFGFVKKYEAGGDYPPFDGVQVRIEGPDTRQGPTDASGRYQFTGVSPGSYLIKVLMPEGFSLARSWLLDESPSAVYFEKGFDKGCIEANFVLQTIN